jgi:Ser-tRNA(Ala) deacylase AlaX
MLARLIARKVCRSHFIISTSFKMESLTENVTKMLSVSSSKMTTSAAAAAPSTATTANNAGFLTRKVFWENPYLHTLRTTVAELDGNEARFAETIAYSESGGQESDRVTVNGIPVVSSRMDGLNITYTLPEGHGLSTGGEVDMKIDWVRRNRLMRYHFTCELVLVLVNRYFGNKPDGEELQPQEIDVIGPKKRGAHMSAESARVDFEFPTNIAEHLPAILEKYNAIIDADLPIEKDYLDEATQRRYWRIPGVALVPCGGTHVRSTGQVGKITLKREKANKGVERIKIKLVDEQPTDPGMDANV